METTGLLLDGETQPASTMQTFDRTSPMGNEPVTRAAAASIEDATRAVNIAASAFPAWSATKASARRQILLKASESLRSRTDQFVSAMAAEIATLLKESIIQVRDLSRGLGPIGLNQGGLDGALEALALSVRQQFGVTCTFECDRPFLRAPPEAESHLVRIAQEAVNNAINHGKADRIEISLGSKGGQALLCIEDNGVGMPMKAPTPEGAGLHTMAYRARLIGGSLEVRRRTPRGTTVTCAFPLSGKPDTREKSDHVRKEN